MSTATTDTSSLPIAPGDSDHGRFRVALELGRAANGMTVVDWGCAHGWFATTLAERLTDARVIACDIPYAGDPPQFEGTTVEYQVFDESGPVLSLPDGCVDRVFLLDVLEHMGPASRPLALAEIRRVLREDGRLIVTVPYRGALHWTDVENIRFRFPRLHRLAFGALRGREFYQQRYGVNRLANFSTDAEEHHHYTFAELTSALGRGGFRVETRRYFGVAQIVPWSLTMLSEAVAHLTGRSLPVLDRMAKRLTLRSIDANPPAWLAEWLGVTARPESR